MLECHSVVKVIFVKMGGKMVHRTISLKKSIGEHDKSYTKN